MVFWKRALDLISAPLSQPKIFLTRGIGAAADKVRTTRKGIRAGKGGAGKVILKTLASTGVVASAIFGGSAIVSSARAGTLLPAVGRGGIRAVKSVTPKTLRGKVALGTGGLISAGVLKSSPKARVFVAEKVKSAPKIPGKIIGFGEEVGGVIEGKSVFVKEDILKGVKTAGLVGGAVALGAAIIPKAFSKFKGNGEEKAIETTPTLINEPSADAVLVKEKAPAIATNAPSSVPVQTLGTTPTRRRRTKKKAPTSMKQSVRVNVINNSGNRKYIKGVIYA